MNDDGNQPIPVGVMNDPVLTAGGPIEIVDNIFRGYNYTGPQPTVGVMWRPSGGVFGGALEFDGVDDFGVFKDSAFDVGTAGTLSFWVNMDDVSRRNQFFEGPDNGAFETQFREDNSGQLYSAPFTSGSRDYAIRTGPDGATFLNTWSNVQVTWDYNGLPAADGGGKLRVYVDGAESSYLTNYTPTDINWSGVISTVDQLMTVGRDAGDNRYFDGKMDDIGWFDAPLSAADRQDIRDNGVVSLSADSRLVAHWDLDQASGDTAVDNANGIVLSVYTNGVLPLGPEFKPSEGVFGGALEFDGVDDFATFQDTTFDVGEKGTLNFWVKMDDASRRNEFFEGPGNAAFESQYRVKSGTGQVYSRPFSGGGSEYVIREGEDRDILWDDTNSEGIWTNIQVVWITMEWP